MHIPSVSRQIYKIYAHCRCKYETPLNPRVMDAAGRVVDARSKVGANSTLQIGHSYSSGTYFAEIMQGTKRKVIQLLKARG